MKRSELKALTRRELYEMAKAYGLTGRSRMGKEDLVDALCGVSARKAPAEPRAAKRRMSKRRHRRPLARARGTAHQAPPPAPSSFTAPQAQPPQPPQPYIDRGPELSSSYGQDKLQVMVRDPNWIYAYWDLSGGVRERLAKQVGGGTWVLRVYDVSRDVYDDVPVLIEGGNWYVPVASDTEYRVDIGIIDQHGVFHVAASSRRIRTPRMGISEVFDEEWMILEEEFRRLLEISGPMARHLSGSRMLSELVRGRHRLAAGLHSAGVSSFGGSRRK
jgi:uncharacterized protein